MSVVSAQPNNHVSPSPTQALQTSESSRALGEIQAMLTIAQSRPRDEIRAIQKITNACQRSRLAELSEYSYSKGGTAISGATIRLLEVIGQNWGNMTWGFRELSQEVGVESTVQAYAWDLENNVKITRDFVVPHSMSAYGRIKLLTDQREIYEWIANQAQRRVRTCLENCIPRDIIEDAREECQKTLKSSIDMSEARIISLIKGFEKYGVSKAQVEARIQRNASAMEAAQYIALVRIGNSMRDGISVASDWFKEVESDGVKDLAAKLDEDAKPDPAEEKPAEPETVDTPIDIVDGALAQIGEAESDDDIADAIGMAENGFAELELTKEQKTPLFDTINDAAQRKSAELKAAAD